MTMKRVRGHPGWWRFDIVTSYRYRKVRDGMAPLEERMLPVFIDHGKTVAHRRAAGPWKYGIFVPGAGPGGCAGACGGADTLDEAITKAEKLLEALT
jgi:hypothetical protein